jgi:uncharacterized RDD family membrane protein YckC
VALLENNNYYDPYDRSNDAETSGQFSSDYAGFWIRLVANIIDSLILSVIAMVIIVPLFVVMVLIMGAMGSSDDASAAAGTIFCCLYCLIMILALVGQWLYFAWFESSKYMATPGKMLLGLIVTDMNGERLSFSKATLRYVAKILTNIVFYLGYIAIAFSSKKQGLYDMIAGTLVIKK